MTAVSAQEKAAVASIGGGPYVVYTLLGSQSVRVTYSIDCDDGQVVLWSMLIGDESIDIHPDYFTQWQIDRWAEQAEAQAQAAREAA